MNESAREGRLLVADDSQQVLSLMRRTLERTGFEVLLAGDAADAVLLAEERSPIDLLLADVTMPGMPGPALIERKGAG